MTFRARRRRPVRSLEWVVPHRPSSGAFVILIAQRRISMASPYRRCDREAFQSPLGTGLEAIQLSPYRAGLAEPNLQRLPVVSASTACFCPVGLSSLGKPLTQGSVAPNALLSAKGINYAPNAAHDQVEPVRNLHPVGRATPTSVGVGFGTVACQNPHQGVRTASWPRPLRRVRSGARCR